MFIKRSVVKVAVIDEEKAKEEFEKSKKAQKEEKLNSSNSEKN